MIYLREQGISLTLTLYGLRYRATADSRGNSGQLAMCRTRCGVETAVFFFRAATAAGVASCGGSNKGSEAEPLSIAIGCIVPSGWKAAASTALLLEGVTMSWRETSSTSTESVSRQRAEGLAGRFWRDGGRAATGEKPPMGGWLGGWSAKPSPVRLRGWTAVGLHGWAV
jgi:hypothetical protein